MKTGKNHKIYDYDLSQLVFYDTCFCTKNFLLCVVWFEIAEKYEDQKYVLLKVSSDYVIKLLGNNM